MQKSLPVTPMSQKYANNNNNYQNQNKNFQNNFQQINLQSEECQELQKFPEFFLNKSQSLGNNYVSSGVVNGMQKTDLENSVKKISSENANNQYYQQKYKSKEQDEIEKQHFIEQFQHQNLNGGDMHQFCVGSKSQTCSPYLFSKQNGFVRKQKSGQNCFGYQNFQNQNFNNINFGNNQFSNDNNNKFNNNVSNSIQNKNEGKIDTLNLGRQFSGKNIFQIQSQGINSNCPPLFQNNLDESFINNQFENNINYQNYSIFDQNNLNGQIYDGNNNSNVSDYNTNSNNKFKSGYQQQQNKFIRKGIKKHFGFHNKPITNYDINDNINNEYDQLFNYKSSHKNAYCVNKLVNNFNNNQHVGPYKQIKKFYRGKKFNNQRQQRQQQQQQQQYQFYQQQNNLESNQNKKKFKNKKFQKNQIDIEEQDFIQSNSEQYDKQKNNVSTSSLLYFNTDLDEDENQSQSEQIYKYEFKEQNENKQIRKEDKDKINQQNCLQKIDEVQQEQDVISSQNQIQNQNSQKQTQDMNKQSSNLSSEDSEVNLGKKNKSDNQHDNDKKNASTCLDIDSQNNEQDQNCLQKSSSNISNQATRRKRKNTHKGMGSMIDQLLDQQSDKKKGRKLSVEQNEEMENFQRLIIDRAAQDDKKRIQSLAYILDRGSSSSPVNNENDYQINENINQGEQNKGQKENQLNEQLQKIDEVQNKEDYIKEDFGIQEKHIQIKQQFYNLKEKLESLKNIQESDVGKKKEEQIEIQEENQTKKQEEKGLDDQCQKRNNNLIDIIDIIQEQMNQLEKDEHQIIENQKEKINQQQKMIEQLNQIIQKMRGNEKVEIIQNFKGFQEEQGKILEE